MIKTVAKVTSKGTWRVVLDTDTGIYSVKHEYRTIGDYGVDKHTETVAKFPKLSLALVEITLRVNANEK